LQLQGMANGCHAHCDIQASSMQVRRVPQHLCRSIAIQGRLVSLRGQAYGALVLQCGSKANVNEGHPELA